MPGHIQLGGSGRGSLCIWLAAVAISILAMTSPAAAQEPDEGATREAANAATNAALEAAERLERHEDLLNRLGRLLKKSDSLSPDIEKLLMALHSHSKEDARFTQEVLLKATTNVNSQRIDLNSRGISGLKNQITDLRNFQEVELPKITKAFENQFNTFKGFADKTQNFAEKTQNHVNNLILASIYFGVTVFFLLFSSIWVFLRRARITDDGQRDLERRFVDSREISTAQIVEFGKKVDEMSMTISDHQKATKHELELSAERTNQDRERVRRVERRVSVAEGLTHRVDLTESQLQQMIAQDQGGRRRRNPFLVGGHVANKRAAIERSETLDEVINDLRNNSFYFEAPPRAGKTTLLHDLETKLGEGAHNEAIFIPVFLDLQAASEETLFKLLGAAMARGVRQFLQSRNVHVEGDLLDDLSAACDVAETATTPEDLGDLLDVIERISDSYLEQLATHGEGLADSVMFALLIDEFAQMNHFSVETRGKFRSIFMSDPGPAILRLVAAGAKLDVWGGTSPFNFMVHKTLLPFDEEEARRLIETASKGIVNFTERAIARAVEASGGLPMELQRVCRESVNVAYEQGGELIDFDEVGSALDRLRKDSGGSGPPQTEPTAIATSRAPDGVFDEEHQDVAAS